jgi:hypothetical protein
VNRVRIGIGIMEKKMASWLCILVQLKNIWFQFFTSQSQSGHADRLHEQRAHDKNNSWSAGISITDDRQSISTLQGLSK